MLHATYVAYSLNNYDLLDLTYALTQSSTWVGSIHGLQWVSKNRLTSLATLTTAAHVTAASQ